ncbi:histidine kinase/DNA gyrase B/HSP90-like ATPase [Micromonospora kangleipakensis]|uniref:histidine kinase n=1 Tax=Micromonospora kangleipakensis TaxID=1077942 RepID=A0A4Q8BFY0_9ACTN|nr:ATP-binding protein [Micromonospora kangleipakensis]RZU76884.1 histidine kinase/DNA gyrase B/HSP90-like ATPase [Micromonospora kangleipakensis]
MRAARLTGCAAAAVAVAVAVLSVAAVRADLAAASSVPADLPAVLSAGLDVAVGLAFALAALAAAGSAAQRLLVVGTGAAWLAGSVLAEARSLHQGLLACALLAFPVGRIRGAARLPLVAAAAATALQLVPQAGVAALFATVAVVAWARPRPVRAAFPAAAGALLAAVLLFAWWGGQAPQRSPVPPLVAYEAALLAVAAGFVAATRAPERLADAAVHATEHLGAQADAGTGVPGLRIVLAELLGDPDLRIDVWDPAARCYADPLTGAERPSAAMEALDVPLDGAPAARVVSTASALADPGTAAAVRTAVGLTVANQRLREAHERRVEELRASRRRLLAAADRERDRAAAALRTDVIADLDRAAAALEGRAAGGEGAQVRALIDGAVAFIATAASDVRRIVGGAPPSALGAGRLRDAVGALAAAAPVPVSVDVDPVFAAGATAETALFYVCSEALTNVAKHAGASRAWIRLRRADGRLVLEVGDDGRGGADPHGSGLQGLADRLAAHGGRLSVVSPAGGGTVVTATVAVSPADGSPAGPSTAPAPAPAPPTPSGAPPPATAR